MKTAEEKAIAFVQELQREELTNSNHSGLYIINEVLGVAHESFIAGYEEATRWIDPKVELPEDSCDVIVKTDNGNYHVCYYWQEKGDFVYWDCPRTDVIGYRPIE